MCTRACVYVGETPLHFAAAKGDHIMVKILAALGVDLQVCMCMYMYVSMCVYVCMRIHQCVCIYTCTYMYHILARHTHTHTHTHTQVANVEGNQALQLAAEAGFAEVVKVLTFNTLTP